MCLTDFAAPCQCVKHARPFVENYSSYLAECDFEDENEDDPCIAKEMYQNKDDPCIAKEMYQNKDDPCIAKEMYQNESILKGGIKLIKRNKPKVICSVEFNTSKDPGSYFREPLMLCEVPWRNEANDITEQCQSYQERYETLYHLSYVNRTK